MENSKGKQKLILLTNKNFKKVKHIAFYSRKNFGEIVNDLIEKATK